MKKEQGPVVAGLIAVIIIAIGIAYWQMRPKPSDSTSNPAATAGQGSEGANRSPEEAARAKGEFTPAPR